MHNIVKVCTYIGTTSNQHIYMWHTYKIFPDPTFYMYMQYTKENFPDPDNLFKSYDMSVEGHLPVADTTLGRTSLAVLTM